MKLKFAFIVLLFLFVGTAFGQSSTTPEQKVKSFYKWYLHELNADGNPVDQKARMSGFISARLSKWIYSKAYEEYDADYFLDAQDWEKNWENGISVSKMTIAGNTAKLKVTLSVPKGVTTNFAPEILLIMMVKEGGDRKIDRVKRTNR